MFIFEFIRKIYQRIQYKKLFNRIMSSLTQVGTGLELKPNTIITLFEGSTKDDIVIHNNVMLLDCRLWSSHHGKIVIGNNCKVGPGSELLCVDSISIGDYTTLANNVKIVDNNNHPISPLFRRYMRTTSHKSDARSWIHADHKPIVVGENCWIGENTRIQKGVTIGDNSIIAACSVVTKDVPANSIAAGNPAKIVKTDIHLIPAPTSCEEYNEYMKKMSKVSKE